MYFILYIKWVLFKKLYIMKIVNMWLGCGRAWRENSVKNSMYPYHLQYQVRVNLFLHLPPIFFLNQMLFLMLFFPKYFSCILLIVTFFLAWLSCRYYTPENLHDFLNIIGDFGNVILMVVVI